MAYNIEVNIYIYYINMLIYTYNIFLLLFFYHLTSDILIRANFISQYSRYKTKNSEHHPRTLQSLLVKVLVACYHPQLLNRTLI